MDKLEKFKKLLDQYRVLGVEFYTNMVVKDFNELVKTEKELIKMYEEKQEKPVIKCKKYKVNYIGEENCIGQMQDRYEIHWQGKNCWQLNTSEQIEEKDGILTTDDFIFAKEKTND